MPYIFLSHHNICLVWTPLASCYSQFRWALHQNVLLFALRKWWRLRSALPLVPVMWKYIFYKKKLKKQKQKKNTVAIKALFCKSSIVSQLSFFFFKLGYLLNCTLCFELWIKLIKDERILSEQNRSIRIIILLYKLINII